MTERRIYLDNAATSWPKPEAVYAQVDRFQRELGAAAGRGVYAEAVEAARQVSHTRAAVARLLGASDARRIIFTANGTDSLNLALHGLLRSGDHVVTSVVEHNSVLRPLRRLEETCGVTVSRVGVGAAGVVDPDEIGRAIGPHTRLIVLSHASNVSGALQPVAAVGALARAREVPFLVDAAQTLGHLPLDVSASPVDLVAAPGHKGLLGPLGTGVLYVASGWEEHLASTRQGGTGSHSEDDHQPATLPDKYESGNLNVMGIMGLGGGAGHLLSTGLETVRQHALGLTRQLLGGLAEIDGVRIFGPAAAADRVGVVSITVEGYAPQEVAALLEASYRIQVRAGLHCAPAMHRAFGTLETGGTVRFSLGLFNTEQDIDAAIGAIRELASASLLHPEHVR